MILAGEEIRMKIVVNFLFLVLELGVLYFLSLWLTKSLFLVLLLVFRVKSVAISLITLLFFPGTVIHELAHLFTAEILGVRTGRLNLVPEVMGKEGLRTGSVAVAETGPFRRAAIGLAPIFVGILVLTALSFRLPELWLKVQEDWRIGIMWSQISVYYLLLTVYLLFSISNSIFSSREDLRGFLPFAGAITIVMAGLWWAGFRLVLTGPALELVTRISGSLVSSLALVLAVNLVLVLIMQVLVILVAKIFHLRIKS